MSTPRPPRRRYVQTMGYALRGTDEARLYYDPKSRCGLIEDGVGFWHGSRAGGWVVSLDDLRRIVREAEKARRG